MNKRFGLIFGAITAFAMLFYASFSIIQGGLINLAKATVFIAPFIFILFLHLRKSWYLLIPVFLVADAVRLPVYGLQKLSLILMLLLVMMVTLILDRSLHYFKNRFSWSWQDKAVLILALILTARLIYDRPGFVALGMAEGGFISSFTFVMASWFYFPVKRVVRTAVFTRKRLKLLNAGVFVVCTLTLLIRREGVATVRYFGNPSFWMLCAVSLSLLSTSPKQIWQTLGFYITSFFFLGLGVVSTFRSRAFFFLSEILAISWIMKRFRRTVFIVGIGGVLGILLVVMAAGDVPELMKRFLSLFMDIDTMNVAGSGGAMGWQDSFRLQLLQAAWAQIKVHPFIGSGFGLNVEEAIGILMVGQNVGIEMLALGRSYHNSIAILVVTAGLPAAILFVCVLLSVAVRFIRGLFHLKSSAVKTWGIAIFAFWVANFFYILMNGGPEHYFNAMVLSGYMFGMLKNPQFAQESVSEE